jgi:putative peptidoglycan lipid II flippase
MKQKDRNKKLVRSTLSMTAPTLLSRILGYIRDMFQAFYLGTSRSADAFSIAFIIPNLLRRLTGEAAMTAAFIPIFTQLKKEKSKADLWKFANYFFFDLTLIVTIFVVLGIVFSPLIVKIIAYGFKGAPGKWELTIFLTRIMFPYIFFISLAALVMAILNSFHKFVVPAFAPVLYNISVIMAALIFAGRSSEPAVVFAVGVVIGGMCQLAFQLPFLWRRGMRYKPMLSFSHPAIRRVGRLMIPGIFGLGISQINFAVSRMIASVLEEGSVSSLYYATRVQELTMGLFSIALSIALLPTFSELAAQQDIGGMKKTLSFSLKLIFLVTFPAMVGLFVLNRPIIQVLFQRGVFDAQSTTMSASCLLFFALGLPFVSGARIIAPAFYSLKDTKTPAIVAFFVMVSYISLALILMNPLRVGGIALALSLASVLNFFLLYGLLERKIGKIKKRKIVISALKSFLSASGMGVAVWYFIRQFAFERMLFGERLGVLAAAISLGVVVYLLLNLLFNHEDMRGMRGIFSSEKILSRRERR